MVLKEKRFTPPKRHHSQGDPRRTWPSLERLIAEQEAHYQNGAKDEPRPQEPNREDNNQDRPAYRADSLVVPIDESITAHQFPDFDPPEVPKPVKLPETRTPGASYRYQPPRDWNTQYEENQRRRSKRPLEDATSYEMARLYAWAYYRLQRLAVQIEQEIAAKEAEVKALQSELNGEPEPKTEQQPTKKRMNENEDNNIKTQRHDRPLRINTPHAQAELGMAPALAFGEATTEASEVPRRGPP